MKKQLVKAILGFFSFASALFCQDTFPSTKDSISHFYASFFSSLEQQYLHRDEVDWKKLRTTTLDSAFTMGSLEASIAVGTMVFDSIGCNHCLMFSEKWNYGSSLNTPLAQEDFSRAFLLEHEKQPKFSVKLLQDNVGYILMPGMLLLDYSQEELNREAQKMYDAILALSTANTLQGWIIDLRFNIGGNVYPMLAALYDLLGDTMVYGSKNIQGNILEHWLKGGGFYSGDKLEVQISPKKEPNPDVPMAIIVGKMTASAGEDVAIAFKHKENAVVIGDESYGFLTANDMQKLPFGVSMAFTTGYIVDSKGVYTKNIVPNVTIIKGDNFEDYTEDKNIEAALRFIKAR